MYKDIERRSAARDRLRRPRRRRWAPTPRRPPTSPTSRRASSPPAAATVPSVIVIDTEAVSGTGAGGHWWDVAVPAGRRPRAAREGPPALRRQHPPPARLQLRAPAMILYGTNPIAWSNDDDWSLGDHLSLEDCLGDCQRIGFDGIEKGHKMPDEGRALKAKLAEYGLRFAAGWHSTNILVNDIETEKKALQAWIDFTKAAGGDHINACECSNTVHGNDKVPVNDRPIMTDAEWERFSTGYEELSRLRRRAGREDGLPPPHGHDRRVAPPTSTASWRWPARTPASCSTPATPSSAAPTRPRSREKYMDRVTHIHAKNIRPEIMRGGPRAEPLLPRGRAPRRLHRAGRPRGLRRLRAGAADRRRARLLRLARHRGRAGPAPCASPSTTRTWA